MHGNIVVFQSRILWNTTGVAMDKYEKYHTPCNPNPTPSVSSWAVYDLRPSLKIICCHQTRYFAGGVGIFFTNLLKDIKNKEKNI